MTNVANGAASLFVGSALGLSVLAGAGLGWGPGAAEANSSASAARLEATVAALEARVAALAPLEGRIAALEAKLKRVEAAARTERTAQPENTARTAPLLVSLTQSPDGPEPMRIAPVETAALPDVQEQAQEKPWSGFYWGTSFGVGTAKSDAAYRYTQSDKQRGVSHDSFTDLDDVPPTVDTDVRRFADRRWANVTGVGQDSEWHSGAVADLYLGASTHLTPRIVAGLQVEGTLSQMRFESEFSGETGKGKSKRRSRSVSRSTDGDRDVSRRTETNQTKLASEFGGKNTLELDYMVSVIGRAGWLANPTTLLYGLGGYTYGHFDAEDLLFTSGLGQISDFGSHGFTAGGGIEKKLSPLWSLRAEYRYTHFAKESFSTARRQNDKASGSGSSSSSFKSTCCGGEVFRSSGSVTSRDKDKFTTATTSKGYFDNQMHVGRVGVTRYFTLGE